MASKIPTIQGEVRDKLGTRYTARLRKQGMMPAVVYGHGQGTNHVTVNSKLFHEALQTGAHLYDLIVDGKTEHVILKSVQWDYLGRSIIHADLSRVDLTEKVETEVNIVLVGESKAAGAAGAILDHPVTSIVIKSRADAIPDNIEVDLEPLTDDKAILVGDITLPDGVELVSDGSGILANIVQAKIVEADEEEATAEPDVIEKGKKEEDGE